MTARDDAHQLVDAVPDDRVPVALELLRQLVQPMPTAHVGPRHFRTVGVFDGESDLGSRAKAIARRELGGEADKTT
jgi:hypothetical protein